MVVDVFEVVVDGCRWLLNFFEVVVGGCRWFWVVLGGCRSFHVLVTTYILAHSHFNIHRRKRIAVGN